MHSKTENNNKDIELIEKIHNGSDAAFDELLQKYSHMIRTLAGKYNIYSLDTDDYIQEGFIAFLSAVKSFSAEKNDCFAPYAAICVKNHLIDENKRFSRDKHKSLNNYEQLDEEVLSDVYDSNAMNPESILIERENINTIMQVLGDSFSPLENDVFRERLKGCSYSDIAKKYNVSAKSVDNALQRIRKKIMRIYSN